MNKDPVVIVSMARTPMGGFGGDLSNVSATALGSSAIEAAVEGKVRGMLILGENPMISDANQAQVKQALEKLDFLAVIDIFPTETAQLADVILPAACYGPTISSNCAVKWRRNGGALVIFRPTRASRLA